MRTGAHDYIMKGNLARLAPAVERELREANVPPRAPPRQPARRLPRLSRLADRSAEPRALPRPAAAGGPALESRRQGPRACCSSISTASRQINDALGHHAGDLVLQEVASRLRERPARVGYGRPSRRRRVRGVAAGDRSQSRRAGRAQGAARPATPVRRGRPADDGQRQHRHRRACPGMRRPATRCCRRADSAMYLAKGEQDRLRDLQPGPRSARQQPLEPGRIDAAGDRRPAIRCSTTSRSCNLRTEHGRRRRIAGALEPSASSGDCCRTNSSASPNTPAWSIR